MRREMLLQSGVLLWIVFLTTVLSEIWLIPRLRARRAAQPILEIGPSWHLCKSGTPTLGGLGFVFAVLMGLAVLTAWSIFGQGMAWQRPALLVLFAFFCALIGFLDDWKKLSGRKNQGLTAAQKYFLQLLVSGGFLFLAEVVFGLDHTLPIPFTQRTLSLGGLYYPFALIYLTGLVNAFNLTDGVDGLLSGTTGVFAALLVVMGSAFTEELSLIVGVLLLGSVLGFLCFNAHPAKVFMGDTGSLFLGAMAAGYGILSPSPLAVLIGCFVFVIEAASVALQVIYFKLSRGKRLFRMAPLHHHFEKLGWSENRVVAVFSLAGAVFAVLALLGR